MLWEGRGLTTLSSSGGDGRRITSRQEASGPTGQYARAPTRANDDLLRARDRLPSESAVASAICHPLGLLDPILRCAERRQTLVARGAGGYVQPMASKTNDSRDSKDSSMVTALGESALTGLPGKLGGAVAKPVSKHTRWSEQQIRAAIGLALLAWALYRVLRPTVRAVRSR
jgi:hypothetical protein